jgi:hypothetical protein
MYLHTRTRNVSILFRVCHYIWHNSLSESYVSLIPIVCSDMQASRLFFSFGLYMGFGFLIHCSVLCLPQDWWWSQNVHVNLFISFTLGSYGSGFILRHDWSIFLSFLGWWSLFSVGFLRFSFIYRPSQDSFFCHPDQSVFKGCQSGFQCYNFFLFLVEKVPWTTHDSGLILSFCFHH